MRQNIFTIALIIGLLFFTKLTRAEEIAGRSAMITYSNLTVDRCVQKRKLSLQRRAIERVLARYNSPMTDSAEDFITACQKFALNCYLLPSIAGLESTFGNFIRTESYNPFGWGRGLIMFPSWKEGIYAVAEGLRNNYMNNGANDLFSIGKIYSESSTWAVRVGYFIHQLENEEQELELYLTSNTVEL